MAQEVTIKPIKLKYREVGATTGEFTEVMGVLKGMALTQDNPEMTDIEAQFYSAPFVRIPKGQPLTLTFSLVKFDIADLPAMIGGTLSSDSKTYQPDADAKLIYHQWVIDFGSGYDNLIIYNGQTVQALGQDDDAALGFNIEITALPDTSGQQWGLCTDAQPTA